MGFGAQTEHCAVCTVLEKVVAYDSEDEIKSIIRNTDVDDAREYKVIHTKHQSGTEKEPKVAEEGIMIAKSQISNCEFPNDIEGPSKSRPECFFLQKEIQVLLCCRQDFLILI
jgi:hypothetical protein